jgi:hypothetical protein
MRVTAEVKGGCFTVRQPCDVEVIVQATEALSPGDVIEVQFPHTWGLVTGPSYTRELQTTDPAAAHYICVEAPGTSARYCVEIRRRQLNFPSPAATVRHGRQIVATLTEGTVPAGATVRVLYANTFAPYVAETEQVWLRVRGVAPEVAPQLTVTPGPAESMRVLAPSGVEPGQRFDVLLVSLDRFENRSCTRCENQTLTTTDGTVIAFLPGFVGSLRVPVTLERPGTYRFRWGKVVSNAVRVERGRRGPYWGDIHIHTKLSHDGQGTDPYIYARDVSGLDFAGTADHWESLGEEGYRQELEWRQRDSIPGRFVTIPGDERNPPALTGHHNIYFRDEQTLREQMALPGMGSKADDETEARALAALDPTRVMLIPHHTGIHFSGFREGQRGVAVDWDAWADPGLRPVIEIYSHHGQSEVYDPQHILSYEFNRMRNPERRANSSIPGAHYAQDYWMAGHRLGVIGSSDEHSGQGGRRHGGLAAVWAEELTREGIFDALRQRHCYATTGERILMDFAVDGIGMGDAARRAIGSRLTIRLRVWGTDALLRVEVLRYRFGQDSGFVPILAEAPRPEAWDAEYELEDTFTGDCMYYARVVQEPLQWPAMAWTSPVWVDSL